MHNFHWEIFKKFERSKSEKQINLIKQPYIRSNQSIPQVNSDPNGWIALLALLLEKIATRLRSRFVRPALPVVLCGLFLFVQAFVLCAGSISAVDSNNSPPAAGVAVTSRPAMLTGSICRGVRAIPEVECDLLLTVYNQTDGANWQNHALWGTVNDTVSPCDWYGVVCENQHVTQIQLSSNGLKGELPTTITRFPALTHLMINDNQLRGTVPLGICDRIERLKAVNVNYNQISAANQRAKRCLDQLNPGWMATQTIPPHEIRPENSLTGTIELSWTPIAYTDDGGYYEVSYTTTRDEPFVVHGNTSDKSSSSYIVDGLNPGETYFFRIRTHTPAHANQENDQWSPYTNFVAVTETPEDDVLLLIYFPADNDLSPYVESVTRRLQIGTKLNPNVRVLMLADRRGDNNTEVLNIFGGEVTRTSLISEHWGRTELDTTDPEVLAWFLRHARNLYPASRTVVSLMGHGVGLSPEFAWLVAHSPGEELEPQTGIPPLPKGLEYTPGDVTNDGGFLSTHDLARALAAATDDGANPFDVVFFDQCFQGNLEALYEIREAARIFIASPNYAWLAAPYHQYLPALTPSKSPEEMARAIIRIYQNSLNEHHPNAIFWVTNSDIAQVADAISNLGTALLEATNAGQDALILQATLNSKYVDTTQCGRQNLVLGPPDELLGAGTFSDNLLRLFPKESSVAVAASDVVQSLTQIEGNAQTGRPYIAPENFWNYDETFTILAPLPRGLPENVVWRASIYTEQTPLTATWTPVPTQTVSITETFAFVRDKQWDEFIDVWYTRDLEPTVGEWCHYIPPVVVSNAITEPLTLQLDAAGDGVQLTWDATGQNSAVEYWVLGRRADGNWRTLAVTDLAQNTHTLIPPRADQPFEFMVVAHDELGMAVAQSNEITLPPADTEDNTLYLPLIQ